MNNMHFFAINYLKKGEKMANLHFHYGVMNCSKTAALIMNAYNFSKKGTLSEVIKPAFDKRSGSTEIASRIGLTWHANAMNDLQ